MVWHCVEHAFDAELPAIVTENTARRVANFLHGFLLPHAIAFYAGTLGLANDHDVMADIAGYILARKLNVITSRDVQQGTRDMRRLIQRETEELFEQLEAFGWLTRKPGRAPVKPAALGGQSGRTPAVRGARKSGKGAPREGTSDHHQAGEGGLRGRRHQKCARCTSRAL